MPIASIDRDAIDAYQRDRMADGVTNATINRAVALVRRMLNYAVDRKHLRTNPIARVEMLEESPARRPVLEASEERTLIEACSPEWLRFLVRVLLATGCRVGEVLALTYRDVDLDRGVLVIRRSKSGASRDVPIHPSIASDLRRGRGTADAAVIVKPDGKRPTLSGAGQAFRRAVARCTDERLPADKRIRQADLRVHDLRHVFTVRALASGLTAFEVARVLGHKDTTMISRTYGDVTPERIKALVGSIKVAKVRRGAPVAKMPKPAKVIPLRASGK